MFTYKVVMVFKVIVNPYCITSIHITIAPCNLGQKVAVRILIKTCFMQHSSNMYALNHVKTCFVQKFTKFEQI